MKMIGVDLRRSIWGIKGFKALEGIKPHESREKASSGIVGWNVSGGGTKYLAFWSPGENFVRLGTSRSCI